MLQRETGKVIQHASIKSQASKDWFYGDDTVESALGTIEGASSSVLRKLADHRNPASLDEQEVTLALIWLALQRARTEAARQASQPMHDQILRLLLEVELNNDQSVDENSRAEMLGTLGGIGANPVDTQRMDMSIAMQSAGALRDLTPVLLANKTNRPFIFGDAPVVLYNRLFRNVRHRGVLGFSSPGLMLVYPLGPTLCLLLLDQERYRVRRARDGQISLRELGDVLALNKLQLHASSSCIYFSDFKHGDYVKALWQQERHALKPQVGTVITAPGFSHETGAAMGDIFHSFLPQLPYHLSLSFLKSEILGDSEYQSARRSRR